MALISWWPYGTNFAATNQKGFNETAQRNWDFFLPFVSNRLIPKIVPFLTESPENMTLSQIVFHFVLNEKNSS